MGRPSDYSEDLVDRICAQIAEGMSLRSICLADEMPDKATVFRWLRVHEVFRDQYARAREAAADALVEEITDIADDGTNDWMELHDKDGTAIGWRENGEALGRSKLRVDARKWLASKLKPKKYGEKLEIGGQLAVTPVLNVLGAGVGRSEDQ
jgi:hypothetical protein